MELPARAVPFPAPTLVAARIARALESKGRALHGARLLVLGIAMGDGEDAGNGAAVEVIEHLARAGAFCVYHDPSVAQVTTPAGRLDSVRLHPPLVVGCDAVVILVANRAIDYRSVVEAAPLVLDAAGVTCAWPEGHAMRV